ncbi:beta-propeller fold lactonase family protein [Okibacterium endophyticum]
MAPSDAALFWLGSYTSDSGGSGTGISLLRREQAGTLQLVDRAAVAASPSWVTTHPTLPVVYAALEASGTVQAFARSGETRLRPLGDPLEVGDSVCHLSATGDALVAACYGDGRVVSVPLGANGSLAGEPLVAAASTDPYAHPFAGAVEGSEGFGENAFADLALRSAVEADTQLRPSRAHTSLDLPGGGFVTTDLGHDTVRFWRRSGVGLHKTGSVTLPFGVGPRHLVRHPSGHLHVVTEYSNEVFTLREARDGSWSVAASVIATADSLETGDSASEISIAPSQEQLHVGVRGSNRIATLQVRGDGSELRPIADVESGGDGPRHHLEDGDVLHVANERSGHVSSLRLDERGVPRTLVGRLEIGSPACLARA